MTKNDKNELIKCIKSYNSKNIEVIDNTDLVIDLEFGSLEFISLIVDIESLFNITIPIEDIDLDEIRNVGTLCEIISRNINN